MEKQVKKNKRSNDYSLVQDPAASVGTEIMDLKAADPASPCGTLEDKSAVPRCKRTDRILKSVDRTNEAVGKAASFLILALALVVSFDVVMRYMFNLPTVWAQETSTMLFGTFIILGGGYTALSRGHVNMDVVYSLFSKRGKVILDVITFFLLTLPFLGVLIWKGGQASWKSLLILEHDSTQWSPPLYPFRLMLPIGALLFLLQAAANLIRDVRTAVSPDREV